MDERQIVIITGMSGAGKTTALKFLEDIGFYCVDNLPPALIPRFVEVCFAEGLGYDRLAMGIDIRGGKLFDDLLPAIESISKDCGQGRKIQMTVLYLDSDDETLHRRYKETRRDHPLAKTGRLMDGISAERDMTLAVRSRADCIIDTSKLLTRELKELISKTFLENQTYSGIIINLLSFGFKYGLPNDADMVLDVRFIPNPFYLPELKYLTGEDKAVRDYVMSFDISKEFLAKTKDLMDILMPHYIAEGKTRLVLCIGCTGGQHRSVTIANYVYAHLMDKGYNAYLSHRDIKEAK